MAGDREVCCGRPGPQQVDTSSLLSVVESIPTHPDFSRECIFVHIVGAHILKGLSGFLASYLHAFRDFGTN